MATLYRRLLRRLQLLMMIVSFKFRAARFALTLKPIAGGAPDDPEDDPEDEPEDKKDPEGDPEEDPEDDPEDKKDPAKPARREPDWKRMARKHEREAKKAREDAKKLQDALKAREDADKSEQEKAIEEAEQRARNDLQGQFEKERRQDRLELATTKAATRGVTVGDGDDAKTVKFADPDDAMVHLERAIRNGDVDEDDIFDEGGKVRSDNLEEALADLLARKPHLAADTKPASKVKGSADAGKGSAAKSDSSVDDHLKKIRRHSSEKGQEGARYRKAA